MPRVIRDSDEEVESKSSTRKTRASLAATSVTDSPARRSTRRTKQAATESSPESIDDRPKTRTTRSRATTLDKPAAAGLVKNLRSRKNSASSNVSETPDLESETTQKRVLVKNLRSRKNSASSNVSETPDTESETTQKRVTRKTAATTAAVGTPTKTNLRSRNIRAGSEAKSTPPASRSTRVTRASSVDPFNTPNEIVGTPVKRRTRASIAPVQQTLAEEQETNDKTPQDLNNTAVDIDENSENESVSSKSKSRKKITKDKKISEKDTSTEQSNMETSEITEGNVTDKSYTSIDTTEESTLKANATHLVTSAVESFTSTEKENTENIDLTIDQNLITSDESYPNNDNSNDCSEKSKVDNNIDEYEHVDVENFTLTDDSIDVVNSPKKNDIRDTLALDVKDSYVKLDRADCVEKIVSNKLEENGSGNSLSVEMKDSVSLGQNNVIQNAKTAIVLVNDFVKSNEYFSSMKDKQIFDSGISLNNKEDSNSNVSVHNSDDDQISIVTIEDNDEELSLQLLSPSKKETDNEKLVIDVLPDDEKLSLNANHDEIVSVDANVNTVQYVNFEKSNVCLNENVETKSQLESENVSIADDKNDETEYSSKVDIVNDNTIDEIGDEPNLVLEVTEKLEDSEKMNIPADSVANPNPVDKSQHHNDSIPIDDNAIISVNVKSPSIEIDLTLADSENDEKNEIVEMSLVENDSNTNDKVESDKNMITEQSDCVSVNGSDNNETIDSNSVDIGIEIEKCIKDIEEELEKTDTSISESELNFIESHDIAKPCVSNENNTNENEPTVSLEDKNGVPSAVTDADGENASSPTKKEQSHEISTDTTSTASPQKTTRKSKSRVIDSDLDESAENLFQDIPAEEWSEERSKKQSNESKTVIEDDSVIIEVDRKSINKNKSVVEEPCTQEDTNNQTKESRKSLIKKEFGKLEIKITEVANDTENQEDGLSDVVKVEKSSENKRESNQSSDSGIQDSNKTVAENDGSDNEMNESRNKSRRSLDKSLKANQSLSEQSKNDSIAEKLSKSLIDNQSLNKSRKSLNNSIQYNVSVFDSFRKKNDSLLEQEAASLNISTASKKQSRKSIAEEKLDEDSEVEKMEVDEESDNESEMNNANHSLKKGSKSPNKSQIGRSPSKNESIAEKLSASLNTSKTTKRNSPDKSLNKSSRKSFIEQVNDDETGNDVDSNESVENVSESLNDSKKLKKRSSEKFNESARKSLVTEENEEQLEKEETEVDVVADKSPNKSRRSSLKNESFDQAKTKTAAETSFKNEDESPIKTPSRKSATKPLNISDDAVDDHAETEEGEKNNESTKKSPKSILKSPTKVFALRELEKSNGSVTEDSPQKKGEELNGSASSVLDTSVQKSIQRMKFSNPPKHDLSTVVQVNTSSDDDSDDSYEVPNYMFRLSDEEIGKSSDEESEENDIDSDIEKEYNLGGKDISKYSDDDVAGDDCRASEQEFSDTEDDGSDLEDFVISDGEEEEEDEDEDEDDDDEDEDEVEIENENEDEGEGEGEDENEDEDEDIDTEIISKKNVSVSKKNISINSSQSTLKNSTLHPRRSGFSQSSGSESDDEATEAENKNSKDTADDSRKILKDKNTSLHKKDKSMNKSSKSFNESQIQVKDKSLNISAKNKSLKLSESIQEKSANISKSKNDKSAVKLNDSKLGKNKSVLIVENGETESSSSESDEHEEASQANTGASAQIASPSESVSESEEGEDTLHIINAGTAEISLIKPQNKKLIDCSTPKPGSTKKTNITKDRLSITDSRRKSESLNDLTDSKMISSRLSISEAANKSTKHGDTSMKLKDNVEIVATPEVVTKNRQAWKLIPLNHTAHPAVEDTPGTKFLKKSKLNDSFPVLESMKSSDLPSSGKKNKKVALVEAQVEEVQPKQKDKSKKRKLMDMSNVPSIDEDSILKVSKKKKKRARLEDSTVSSTNEEQEIENIEKSSKKKSKNRKESAEIEEVEVVQKSKKTKKNKSKETEVEEIYENVEEKPKKKRKNELLETEENQQSVETEKSKKKKFNVTGEAESDESPKKKKKDKKSNKKQATGDDDDGAPDSVGFEKARDLALNEMQKEAESIKAMKDKLKKKRKDQVDRPPKEQKTKSLKRLSEDFLENLTEEPLRRPDKRQKLSRNKERSVIMPSKSMFSPGKHKPDNLRVDDGYIPLSSDGGTTQFAVVNLQKAKKAVKKNNAVLNFREKMLARNKRMPTATYLSYLKKQKSKNGL